MVPRILVNLPPGFFTHTALRPHFERLAQIGALRATSHDTPEQIAPDLRWAEAVIMWSWPVLDVADLEQAPDLRFLGQINTTQTTARACLARGVALSEARHAWSPAVAEMALALILSGLRRASDYHSAMRRGDETWVGDFPGDIDQRERELTGRAVGIVGFGRIGQRLAQLLAPFETPLRVYDPFLPAAVAQQYGAQQVPLLDLIAGSDVVVLCAANNEGARHLLGRAEIAALRKDSVLVNVGRSMLIDMPGLVERLGRGDMIALLDVFDREPLEADSPLRRLPNAYLTPHRAGGLLSSVERALAMLADDLQAHLAGRALRCAVTEAMLPSFPER